MTIAYKSYSVKKHQLTNECFKTLILHCGIVCNYTACFWVCSRFSSVLASFCQQRFKPIASNYFGAWQSYSTVTAQNVLQKLEQMSRLSTTAHSDEAGPVNVNQLHMGSTLRWDSQRASHEVISWALESKMSTELTWQRELRELVGLQSSTTCGRSRRRKLR